MRVEKRPLTLSDGRPAQVKVRETIPEPTVVVTVGKVSLTVFARDWLAIVDAADGLLP